MNKLQISEDINSVRVRIRINHWAGVRPHPTDVILNEKLFLSFSDMDAWFADFISNTNLQMGRGKWIGWSLHDVPILSERVLV